MDKELPLARPTPFTLPHLYALSIDTSIQAGFPSPAEDHSAKRIDVLEKLIRHPQATYQMRVKGDSMRDEGIFDGDIILIDRAITPRNGHIVVAEIDGEFLVKKFVLRQGRMKLKAGNPTFADIIPKDGQTLTALCRDNEIFDQMLNLCCGAECVFAFGHQFSKPPIHGKTILRVLGDVIKGGH